jgi:hypothetical protein
VFNAKQCGACEELMPMYEKICYCGGPIKIVQANIDQREKVNSYRSRAWLRSRKIWEY